MEEYSFLDMIKEEIFPNATYVWILIVCIILFILIIVWNIAKPILRKMEMKRFAKKYNLQFLGDEKKKFRALDYSQKKNIIKGVYNGKQIEIFDFHSFVTEPFDNYRTLIFDKFDPLTKANITFINGKSNYALVSSYTSASLIKKILDNKIKIKEWGTFEFNKKEQLVWILFVPLLVGLFFLILAILFKDYVKMTLIIMLITVPVLIFIMFFGHKNYAKQKMHNIGKIMTRVLLHDPRGYYDELDKKGTFDYLKRDK